MRQTLLIAIAAGAIGAAVGAVVATSAAPAPPSQRAAPTAKELASAIDAALGPRVAELRREVAGLRADLAAAGAAVTADVALAPAASRPGEDPARSRSDSTADAALRAVARLAESEAAPDVRLVVREAGDVPTPALSAERLRALHGWDASEDVRARWLFLGERSALGWFGTPTRIDYDEDDDTEEWVYEWPLPDLDGDGEPDDTRGMWLYFRNGRLVDIDDYGDE